ncbi:hypothetical protein KO481_30435 [Nocardia sp. NEAU-G5]|uniref:Uncharacterized protein n=1 Tax=Nocardia albiluteola TaxID=2842303 RepID=A0ABS6B6F0_9NOCA|nr:hypothetical protein [Nocardia albiluteola]MBU3065829.1 hypothetical protein [Nocardia albiluteola]
MTRNAPQLDSAVPVARPDQIERIVAALATLGESTPQTFGEPTTGTHFRAVYRVLPDGRVERGLA